MNACNHVGTCVEYNQYLLETESVKDLLNSVKALESGDGEFFTKMTTCNEPEENSDITGPVVHVGYRNASYDAYFFMKLENVEYFYKDEDFKADALVRLVHLKNGLDRNYEQDREMSSNDVMKHGK